MTFEEFMYCSVIVVSVVVLIVRQIEVVCTDALNDLFGDGYDK